MPLARPSELELQVLSVLWTSGPSTVRDVLERMRDGKKRSYTTILTVLQVLEGKKLVRHRVEGRAHVYHAAVSRKQVLGPLLRNLVERVFGGSTTLAVQQLISENPITADELDEIDALLSKARAREKGGRAARRIRRREVGP